MLVHTIITFAIPVLSSTVPITSPTISPNLGEIIRDKLAGIHEPLIDLPKAQSRTSCAESTTTKWPEPQGYRKEMQGMVPRNEDTWSGFKDFRGPARECYQGVVCSLSS